MYIIKNALRNIVRNRGKHVLLGLIALVIGLSSCLALSIRQAANKEKEAGMDALNITASIGVDRMSMMQDRTPSQDSENGETQMPDKKEMFSNMSSLTLDEYLTYAEAESVKEFYYTDTLSVNGSGIDAITTSQSTSTNTGKAMPQGMGSQSDFSLVGYSSLDAMTAFIEGTASITEGDIFQETDTDTCVINEELAEYNDVSVGDRIVLVNPDKESETYTLRIVGIYTTSETTQSSGMGRGMSMMDPANQIYTTYQSVSSMLSTSQESNAEDTSLALSGSLSGTYVFENIEAYEAFEEEARALGLSDEYTVSSQDVSAYERSLEPLENLSMYAMLFLGVVLVIGGVVLMVLHIYHIRERKYEIGVLAAIGMNKKKIATQFVTEIFLVTMLAVLIGTGIGACVSVPVTNTLLASSATSSSETMGNRGGFGQSEEAPSAAKAPQGMMELSQQYLSEVSSATDLIVVLQVCGVALALVIASSGIAVMSILRYEPLKILSNRE